MRLKSSSYTHTIGSQIMDNSYIFNSEPWTSGKVLSQILLWNIFY